MAQEKPTRRKAARKNPRKSGGGGGEPPKDDPPATPRPKRPRARSASRSAAKPPEAAAPDSEPWIPRLLAGEGSGTSQKLHERRPGSTKPARTLEPRAPGEWRGKPRIELDPSDVYELAAQGITQHSIARLLHVSKSLFEQRLAEGGAVRQAFDAGRAAIELDVKQLQLKSARQLNPALLIWLGKNHAGQADIKSVEFSGPDGGPVEVQADLRSIIMQKIEQLKRSRGRE